jgi:hypothetical protein
MTSRLTTKAALARLRARAALTGAGTVAVATDNRNDLSGPGGGRARAPVGSGPMSAGHAIGSNSAARSSSLNRKVPVVSAS